MKTPRLPPDTDVARISPLPTDEKRRQLQRLKGGFSPWSYDPTRRAIPDLLNAGGSLFSSSADTPFWIIEERIRRECAKHENGIASNLEVARLTYSDHREQKAEAIQQSFGRYYTAPGESIAYWSDVFIIRDSLPLIPFFDFRRSGGLTGLGAKFAASIMQHKIVADYEELSEAQLMLIQFPQAGKARSIKPRIISKSSLFSYEELSAMIEETRSIWLEINEERTEHARRTGTSSDWWVG